jgi:WD40 repeat protein
MLEPLLLVLAIVSQPGAQTQAVGPLVTLSAHLPQAITVAYSPDGQWLATSGANGFVTLRDPATGEIRQVLTGHPGLVHEVAFSPDNAWLASAGAEGIVILWEVEGGKKLLAMQALSEDEGTARTVAFSPDGRFLATGASDGTIKIWDLLARKVQRQLTKQTLPVTSVKFSPDGALLATATGNWRRPELAADLRLWEAASGKEIAQLNGHTGEIKRIDFSPTGKQLVSGGADRAILVWDIEKRTIKHRFRVAAVPGSLTLFKDGRLLAIGDLRGGVTLWEVESGTRSCTYAGHEHAVLGIAVSPDEQCLATCGHDGKMKIWPVDLLSGK